MNNGDLSDVFGSFFSCLIVIVFVGLLIWLIIYLVRKNKEENRNTEIQFLQLLQSIPTDKQILFQMQYSNVKKSPTTALLLDLFLGGIGIHRFYLGETGAGILYLLFCWTAIPGIIAFIELFTISRKVNKMNLDKAREIAIMIVGQHV